MRIAGWMWPFIFAAMLAQTAWLRTQLDDARGDLHLVTGMYNGVLIGRGCGLPK